MSTLRLLLADDHALVRAGMLALLSELPGVTVVAETGDGREALRLIRERKPDIALLDISMPGLNGLELAARVAQEHPATRVIIVSMHSDDESVRRALVAGAAGYLLKNSDRSELELALNTVARGDTWLSPSLTKRVVAAYAQGARAAADGPFEVLTPRQREVLQLVAEGHSNKEIASRLALAPLVQRPPAAVETTCFRVAQEALTNVMRHAQAHVVDVELSAANGKLQLIVRDDGRGFDVPAARKRAAHGGSQGLLSMQERVALAGGDLEIDSAPGRGTTVRARLPLTAGSDT